MSEIIDKACFILQRTHDGDDLDPVHLKLVEMAVNGVLNEAGMAAFQEVYDNVQKGYVKPWFHGIEHLTIASSGYVYWKGRIVEHYTLSWAYSEEAKASATELARRCRLLEETGIAPTTSAAVWQWEKIASEHGLPVERR